MSVKKYKQSNYFSCQTATNIKISLQVSLSQITKPLFFSMGNYPSEILKALVSVDCTVLQVYWHVCLKTTIRPSKLAFLRQAV